MADTNGRMSHVVDDDELSGGPFSVNEGTSTPTTDKRAIITLNGEEVQADADFVHFDDFMKVVEEKEQGFEVYEQQKAVLEQRVHELEEDIKALTEAQSDSDDSADLDREEAQRVNSQITEIWRTLGLDEAGDEDPETMLEDLSAELERLRANNAELQDMRPDAFSPGQSASQVPATGSSLDVDSQVQQLEAQVTALEQDKHDLQEQLSNLEFQLTELEARQQSGGDGGDSLASTSSFGGDGVGDGNVQVPSAPSRKAWGGGSARRTGAQGPDYSKMKRAELLETLKRNEAETKWLHSCLNLVRERHRDEHIRMPKRPGATPRGVGAPVFATELRARERKQMQDMDKILKAMEREGLPPESDIPRQIAFLYNLMKERTAELEQLRTQNASLGEQVEETKIILDVDSKSSLPTTARHQMKMISDLRADLRALQAELEETRAVHKQEVLAREDKIVDLDNQLEDLSAAFDEDVKDRQLEHQRLVSELEHMVANVSWKNELLMRELDTFSAEAERISNLTDDERVRARLGKSRDLIASVQSVAGATMASSEFTTTQPPKDPRLVSLAEDQEVDESLERAYDARHAMRQQLPRLPEDLLRTAAEGEEQAAHSVVEFLKEHIQLQEKRHRAEMEEVLDGTASLQRETTDRVKHLVSMHEDTHADAAGELAQAHKELTEALHDRDRLRLELEVAQANIDQLRQAADDNHQRAVQLHTNFDTELSEIQAALDRDKQSHQSELARLNRQLQTQESDHANRVSTLEGRLDEMSLALQDKEHEIERLQTTFRDLRATHKQKHERLEEEHEQELQRLIERHADELTHQAQDLKATLDTLEELAALKEELEARVASQEATIEQLNIELAEALESALVVEQGMKASHATELDILNDQLADAKRKTALDAADAESKVKRLQDEAASMRETVNALQTAVAMREQEVATCRDVFGEERSTLQQAISQLEEQVENLHTEAQRMQQQSAAEVHDLTEARTVLEKQVAALQQQLTQTKAALEAARQELAATLDQHRSDRDTAVSQHRVELEREREQRRMQEVATGDKLKQQAAEREAIKRELSQAQQRIVALEREADRVKSLQQVDKAEVASRHEDALRAATTEARRSEEEKHEAQSTLRNVVTAIQRLYAEMQRKNPVPMGLDTTSNAADMTVPLGDKASDANVSTAPVSDLGVDASERLHHMSRHFSSLSSDFVRTEKQLSDVSRALDDEQRANVKLREAVEAKASALATLQGAERELRSEQSALQTRTDALADKLEAQQKENTAIRERLAEAQAELSDQAAAASSSQSQMAQVLESVKQGFELEKSNFHHQVSALRADLAKNKEQVTLLRTQLRETEAHLDTLKMKLATVYAEKEQLDAQVQHTAHLKDTAEAKLNELSAEKARLSADLAEAQASVKTLRGDLEHAEAYLATVQRELEEKKLSNSELTDDLAEMKQAKAALEAAVRDHDKLAQAQRNSSYELDVLRREVDQQRHELEDAQHDYLQLKAQGNREKRSYQATISDLERQVEVQNARHQKEREALIAKESELKRLREANARMERELNRYSEDKKRLESQVEQHGTTAREKQRHLATMKKRIAELQDDSTRLTSEKRILEDRMRRDQQKLLSTSALNATRLHDTTLPDRVRATGGDRAVLDRRIATLDSQVRRIGAEMRQQRLEHETSLLLNPSPSPRFTSTVRTTTRTASMPPGSAAPTVLYVPSCLEVACAMRKVGKSEFVAGGVSSCVCVCFSTRAKLDCGYFRLINFLFFFVCLFFVFGLGLMRVTFRLLRMKHQTATQW
eukprot:m.152783 g.152783  ORF g.152783 m.152783 type:complete len:1784 (-) comp14272_c2_seq1:401-5752(-)